MLILFTVRDYSELEVSGNGIETSRVPQRVFMGFGYNPCLAMFGERLDTKKINFGACNKMKRLQNKKRKSYKRCWQCNLGEQNAN
ncbi:MAG: hypothetical protein AABX07_00185 [Nanoarchaeota archaeon]